MLSNNIIFLNYFNYYLKSLQLKYKNINNMLIHKIVLWPNQINLIYVIYVKTKLDQAKMDIKLITYKRSAEKMKEFYDNFIKI